MNYELMAVEILAAVGGSKNISNVTHCATRLRLNLIDQKLIDRKKAVDIDGVMGISDKGGQYQLIIGNSVSHVYDEFIKLLTLVETASEAIPEQKKTGVKAIVNCVFDVLSGTFVMFIPVLIAAGMISAILAVLTSFHLVSAEDPTYIIFAYICRICFCIKNAYEPIYRNGVGSYTVLFRD